MQSKCLFNIKKAKSVSVESIPLKIRRRKYKFEDMHYGLYKENLCAKSKKPDEETEYIFGRNVDISNWCNKKILAE